MCRSPRAHSCCTGSLRCLKTLPGVPQEGACAFAALGGTSSGRTQVPLCQATHRHHFSLCNYTPSDPLGKVETCQRLLYSPEAHSHAGRSSPRPWTALRCACTVFSYAAVTCSPKDTCAVLKTQEQMSRYGLPYVARLRKRVLLEPWCSCSQSPQQAARMTLVNVSSGGTKWVH